jgi:phospholipid/cholesterol/gamma-HCH transport system permease protein
MVRFLEFAGRPFVQMTEAFGRVSLLLVATLAWMFRPPYRIHEIFKQMEFVGVNSVPVVFITGAFTGMVLAIQTYYGFRMFGGESLVGATVALSMTRELGPAITALMVTGRAGSAMAAEIGTMRVTEQIDALYSMSVNPIQYLIMPRVIAGIVMLPVLTIISDFIGIVGGYVVGVGMLNINSGIFMARIVEFLDLNDILNGLIKASVFGLILSLVGCYKGFHTTGGAAGVGRATTQSVVISSVSILISDYFLTAVMF